MKDVNEIGILSAGTRMKRLYDELVRVGFRKVSGQFIGADLVRFAVFVLGAARWTSIALYEVDPDNRGLGPTGAFPLRHL